LPEAVQGVVAERDEHGFAQVKGETGYRRELLEGRHEKLGRGEHVLADQADVVGISPANVPREKVVEPAQQQVAAKCEEQRWEGATLTDARSYAEAFMCVAGGCNTTTVAQVQVGHEGPELTRQLQMVEDIQQKVMCKWRESCREVEEDCGRPLGLQTCGPHLPVDLDDVLQHGPARQEPPLSRRDGLSEQRLDSEPDSIRHQPIVRVNDGQRSDFARFIVPDALVLAVDLFRDENHSGFIETRVSRRIGREGRQEGFLALLRGQLQ
jgi:hypothetical protein